MNNYFVQTDYKPLPDYVITTASTFDSPHTDEEFLSLSILPKIERNIFLAFLKFPKLNHIKTMKGEMGRERFDRLVSIIKAGGRIVLETNGLPVSVMEWNSKFNCLEEG